MIGFFAYKDLKIHHIPNILVESVLSTSVVMLIICAASAFGFYMAWERIPMQIAASLANVTQNPWLLLLLINFFLIVVGMFVEGSAALILLTPLLVPVVEKIRGGIEFLVIPGQFQAMLIGHIDVEAHRREVSYVVAGSREIEALKVGVGQ